VDLKEVSAAIAAKGYHIHHLPALPAIRVEVVLHVFGPPNLQVGRLSFGVFSPMHVVSVCTR